MTRDCVGLAPLAVTSRKWAAAPNGSGPATDATTDQDDVIPATGGGHGLRHERFQIGNLLGEGGMGVVYHAARCARRARDRT